MVAVLSSLSVRREIRQLFFMAMEIAWIATLLNLLDSAVGGPQRPATLWSLWLYPATYLYARLEQNGAARPLLRLALRAVVGAAAGLATLGWIAGPVLPHVTAPSGGNWVLVLAALTKIGIGPVVLAAVACAVAMARGWLLGPRQIDGSGFLAAFQAGIVALFAVAFLRQLAHLPVAGTLIGATLFLAFGLYGLWLNRWLDSDLAARPVGRTGWPLLAAVIVGLVLVAGVVFGHGVDRSVLDWLLTPMFWLLHMLGRLLVFLMSLLPRLEPDVHPAIIPHKGLPPAAPHEAFRFADLTHAVGVIMFSMAIFGLVTMLILRTLADLLRWLNGRGPRAAGIAYEASAFGFLDDLRAVLAALKAAAGRLLRWLGQRLSRRRVASPSAAQAVRDVYARLLKWAARHGWPRPIGQTPNEYLEFLRGTAPHLATDLALITDAYVAVRYGAAVPLPEQIVAVRNGWRRIRRTRKQTQRWKRKT